MTQPLKRNPSKFLPRQFFPKLRKHVISCLSVFISTSEPLVWVASKHMGHCSLRKQGVRRSWRWLLNWVVPVTKEGLTHSHFATETKGRNCQWSRGLQTFSDTSVVRDAGVSLTQLPGNQLCLGLKTIWKHVVLGMMCWEVLLLPAFVESVFVSILIPFPGEMIDIWSSACVVESAWYGQWVQMAARVAPVE